jgi:hypothetical protein
MQVTEGIEILRATAARLPDDLHLAFDPVPAVDLASIEQDVTLSPELRLAYGVGAPAGQIPAFVQFTDLWPANELAARQVGYATNASGTPEPEWQSGWIVIGGEDGDPLIAHVDLPGTPVSIAPHGQGHWAPAMIAPSLGGLYALLASWSSLIIEDFDGERLDEEADFAIKAGFWEAFDAKLGAVADQPCLDAFRSYIAT